MMMLACQGSSREPRLIGRPGFPAVGVTTSQQVPHRIERINIRRRKTIRRACVIWKCTRRRRCCRYAGHGGAMHAVGAVCQRTKKTPLPIVATCARTAPRRCHLVRPAQVSQKAVATLEARLGGMARAAVHVPAYCSRSHASISVCTPPLRHRCWRMRCPVRQLRYVYAPACGRPLMNEKLHYRLAKVTAGLGKQLYECRAHASSSTTCTASLQKQRSRNMT